MTFWFRWIMMTLLAATLTACQPVDRWSVFEEDLDARFAKAKANPRDIDADEIPQPAVDETSLPALDGEGSLALSIEQATMLALSNNRDLAVQQLEPVIIGTFEQIERGVFDPEVFAEAQYIKERANETARSTGGQFSVEGKDTEAAAGIRQQLPTGTEIEATVEQNREISNRAPEQQEARLGLTVTQSLLRGFGPAVNLARIRQAEIDTLASQYQLRGFTESLLAETEIAYWNFVRAAESIAIFESSLQVARQQNEGIQQRIEVGVLAKTEAAAAKAEIARREQALIDARSELKARRLRLMRLMNPTAGGTLDRAMQALTDPRIDQPTPIDDIPDRIKLAAKMRPDLNEARLRIDQNRLETIVTQNGLLPRLDAFIAYGRTGFADTFSRSFRNIDGETFDFTAGVSLSHYLGNRAAEARDRAARTSRQQAAAAVGNLHQLIRLDVQLAVNEVERARQQITASQATRVLEVEALKAEQERFEVGSSTALLVAQAQRDLLAAQIAEVEAIIDYRIARVNLYLAEGTLLERRGISFDRNGVR